MAPPKDIKSVALLSKRPKAQRGGNIRPIAKSWF
jgi:hypothetical protein